MSPRIPAIVTVGVGAWVATKKVRLLVAPHVGDSIIVGEHVITCERVEIDRDYVRIYETRRFPSEQDALDFFKE